MEEEKKTNKEQVELEGRSFNGYLPSPPDDRDFSIQTVCAVDKVELPEEYLTEGAIPVLDQGSNSDCVAHAIATATAYGQYKAIGKFDDLSRGYLYGNRESTDYQGEGMYTREALKSYNHKGDCLTTIFPYTGSYVQMRSRIAEKQELYAKEAAKLKLINYFRLYSEKEIKKAIMLQGSVILGMPVYSGFGKNVKMPTKDSKYLGGHAMCVIGWNKDGWIVQNSWGKNWADKGRCYLPYGYPVDEWWGLTTSKATAPKKDCFLVRAFKFIKTTIVNLIKLFKKK